jgi:hypothetical protein
VSGAAFGAASDAAITAASDAAIGAASDAAIDTASDAAVYTDSATSSAAADDETGDEISDAEFFSEELRMIEELIQSQENTLKTVYNGQEAALARLIDSMNELLDTYAKDSDAKSMV